MGERCKERHSKDENNKLEGMHQKPDQIEEIRWESQNFSEFVVPQEEEEVVLCSAIFSENCAAFEKIWKNMVMPDITQVTT